MPAYYIVLQEIIPEVVDVGLEGRALSKYNDKLEALAEEAGVKPLLSFFSLSREDVLGLLEGDDVAQRGIQIPDKQWFSAEEGLKTITALLQSLREMSPDEGPAIASDLLGFRIVLEAARAHNIGWHLAIDY
jgi:hypothetical protein